MTNDIESSGTNLCSEAADWRVGLHVQGKYRGKLLHGVKGTVVDVYSSGVLGLQDKNGILCVRVEPGIFVVAGADQFVTA